MCIYSPMPHTLSYCALIGKCALIRSNTVSKIRHVTCNKCDVQCKFLGCCTVTPLDKPNNIVLRCGNFDLISSS